MFIEVFIDGSARNNGAPDRRLESACACVIYENRQEKVRYARGLGSVSNNAAEYEALIAALLICSMSDFKDPKIYSDSAVVVNHVNHIWHCRSADLMPLLMSVKLIQKDYPFKLIQVPRSRVWLPDRLCNEFLDQLDFAKKKRSWDIPSLTD